jgi:enoyl-CoA hydratase/carnithine racemase
MSGLVKQWHDDGYVSLTLDRPDKRNALSGPLIEALIDSVDEAHARGARAIVFQGRGKNFSAGFDFSGWRGLSEGDLVLRFIRIEMLLQKIAQSPAVTIALAHGRNFGAAVDLFCVCKVRAASDKTTFCMPGLKFGLVLGTRRFAACVGDRAARSILATARTFDAAEAADIGFVTDRAAAEQWPQLITETMNATPTSEPALLIDALHTERPDTDLAHLARSASTPGLKERIATYLQQSLLTQ